MMMMMSVCGTAMLCITLTRAGTYKINIKTVHYDYIRCFLTGFLIYILRHKVLYTLSLVCRFISH